jgi:trehalose 6-phosphate phosphatase
MALISGRTIENLDQLFSPLKLPAAGLHGLERRDAGGCLHVLGEARALEHLRSPLARLADANEGVLLEDKSRAIAIHYRRAPNKAAGIRHQVEDLVRPSSGNLEVIHGKMVSEIKPRHADKGSAIRAFMSEAPFAGRVPVFLGDDVTDEDGFVAVNALKGHTIHVGDAVPTAAHYRLSSVDEVIDWLETWPSDIDHRHGQGRLE